MTDEYVLCADCEQEYKRAGKFGMANYRGRFVIGRYTYKAWTEMRVVHTEKDRTVYALCPGHRDGEVHVRLGGF